MKLSKTTLDVLSNFARMYDAIVINRSEVADSSTLIRTKNKFSDVYAEITVPETFQKEMKIYNLEKFVKLVNSLGTPDLVLEDNHVSLETANAKLRYMYSDHIVVPEGRFEDPEYILEFDISQADLGNLLNISNTLELPVIKIFVENGKIVLELTKPDYEANVYRLEVGLGESDEVYTVHRDKLNLLPGDYSVKICDGCAIFLNKSIDTLKYVVGLGVDND